MKFKRRKSYGTQCMNSSILEEGCESNQCYSDRKFPFDDQELGSALDVAIEWSHSKGDETLRGLPGNNHISCSSHAV